MIRTVGGEGHRAVNSPPAMSTWPVTKLASSLASHRTEAAISPGRAVLPIGTRPDGDQGGGVTACCPAGSSPGFYFTTPSSTVLVPLTQILAGDGK
jgi:hypothetical protein